MKKLIQRFGVIAAFLLLWQLVPVSGLVDPALLPPFTEVIKSVISLLKSGELHAHIFISLQRVFIGFLLAVLVGIPLGLAMGWFKNFENIVNSLLQLFRQVSPLALYPVFIIFFGIGELSKEVMIFWLALWPILLNTISGVRDIDSILIKSARSFGISERTLFLKVVIPAALPSIFTGLRLSAALAFVVLIAAEMIGAKSGLGFLVIFSQYNFQIPRMYAAIVVIAVLGLIINTLFVWIEKKASKWKERKA